MKLTKFIALIAAAATLAVGCGGDKPEDEKKPAGGATLKADVLSVERCFSRSLLMPLSDSSR